ncbi:O-antigen ligase [Geomicrobium halophilum]|uniref:O-antigen ligase n=1 Tax=Geomicrobium halophilum TaxID=549000 RepID=A0A841PMA7_9BACL|nr:O-antigen ligase family protein [Geomicrobium halophilum]MBB6449890.1 O-antigen ligase [Geomicrobium halophilum]
MKINTKQVLIFFLILTYLSGQFDLSRLGIFNIELEVRYVFLFATILIMLIICKSDDKFKPINKLTNFFFITSLLYLLLLILSFFNSNDSTVASDKIEHVMFLVVLIGLTYLSIRLFNNMDELITTVMKIFLVVSLFYMLPVLISVLGGDSRGSIGVGGPNVVTRILFFGLIAAIYLYMYYKKTFYFLIGVLLFISIILVGSRGGMISAFICLGILMLANIKKENFMKINYKLLIPIFMSLPIVYFLWDYLAEVYTSRFLGLVIDDLHYAGRDTIMENSIATIGENPVWGHGLNAYAVEIGGNYPHNIIIEVLLELGVIGLFVFLPLIIMSIVLLRFLKISVICILPFYILLVSMFSGELFDFRYFFLWGLITLPLLREPPLKNNLQEDNNIYLKSLLRMNQQNQR